MNTQPIDIDPLLKAFHATPDDLAANRSGILGVQQAAHLRRTATLNVVGALFGDAVFIGLVLAAASRPFKPVQLILVGLIAIVALAVGIRLCIKLRRAAAAGVVERLSGPVRVVRQGKTGLFLVVAERDLRLRVRPAHVVGGASYNVYFTPETKRIVAMEQVG